jgi:hypothetical protein
MRRIRLVVECEGVEHPTMETLGEICRLKLDARRAGCELELKDAGPNLVELLNLAGLAALLLGEGERQAEEREEAGGVQEEGELDDPPVA